MIAASGVSGAIGWSGSALTLPASCVFPTLWAFAPNRLIAALVTLAYFLSASRGLPVGAANFFGASMLMGIALWIAASLVFVSVYFVLWSSRSGWSRAVRYVVASALMSVPPLGILGWANPITAAGILFPGWGWWGLAAMVIGLMTMTTRLWPVFALFAMSVTTLASSASVADFPEGWRALDTRFSTTAASQTTGYEQQLATIRLVKAAVRSGANTIILPESALGIWTATTEALWARELKGSDVVVNGGAIVIDEDGYDNVMVQVSSDGGKPIYRQRMPVPVSMWHPWAAGGAKARFLENPITVLRDHQIAPLICYELLLVWPVLQSMLFDPQVLVATGNGWWTEGTNIVAIQTVSANAWAQLFNLPVFIAVNQPRGEL
ncbi:conjugal transfer protein TraB [Pelagibacterium luteolum]|uniref:conjugal transfer protein TraB n=1 Tax=Pelagibacterium luteolum TaxID=440168 RepID=UPI000B83DB87|nr:conjugal transfer protein TraB [Pelagibacterium luteolum]